MKHMIICLHWNRPDWWLGRWHHRVWICPYCRSLWHTVLVPAGFGEHAWMWEEITAEVAASVAGEVP